MTAIETITARGGVPSGEIAIAPRPANSLRILVLLLSLCAIPTESHAQSGPRQPEGIQPAKHQVGPFEAANPLTIGDAADPAPATLQSRPIPPRTGGTVEKNGEKSTRRASGSYTLWSTVLALAGVMALLAGGSWWLGKHGPAKWRAIPNEAVEWLGRKVLEPKISVHLVRCGSRMLLLGVSPDGIRTLSEITDPVEIDLLAGACRRGDASGSTAGSFQSLFETRSRTPKPAVNRSATGREPEAGHA